MKTKVGLVGLVLLLIGAGFVMVKYYSYVFSKVIVGEVQAVERVTQTTAMVGDVSKLTEAQLYSFAVAIISRKDGEIYTASSEDRQWAVVQKGQCAEVRIYPSPPWALDKAGTYFNARLLKLYACDSTPPK